VDRAACPSSNLVLSSDQLQHGQRQSTQLAVQRPCQCQSAQTTQYSCANINQEYSDVNRTYHDAAEALSNCTSHACCSSTTAILTRHQPSDPSLAPKTEPYTYENGSSALLLILSGTLPVTFRGATYGFPVAIWVPHSYPREPPIVYVTPAQDMVLRPGQHVSTEGRIYHPYLAQWAKYWDVSTE
jgi:ESCRT-I complex subunit TSG101